MNNHLADGTSRANARLEEHSLPSYEDRPGTVPGRPSRLLLAAEVPRATAEAAATVTLRWLLAAAPHGDGHPVFVLPGFTAGDVSTLYLRRFLRSKGYFVHGWRLGPNLGPTKRIVRGLEARVAAISQLHRTRCSLIGWSLGGIFARQIARDQPDMIRQVITMGTPLRIDHIGQLAAAPLFRALGFAHDPDAISAKDLQQARPTLRVPATSIYSRTDGLASILGTSYSSSRVEV